MNLSILRSIPRGIEPADQMVQQLFSGGISWVIWIRLLQGGQEIGASDEWGYKAFDQPISAHDMHATILHLLGLDHEKLTYRYSGRDYRLSDISGKPIPQIIA